MNEGAVAIVTGAGSGIGRAVCEQLAGAGMRLVLVGRTEVKLEETMAVIGERSAAPPEMLVIPADVSDQEQARSVVDMAMQQWGRVDVIVNNAGLAPLVPIERTDEDLLYRVFAVNCFGPAHIVARAWPVFRKQQGGCVVNVSSIATTDPFPGFFAYAAAKSALESMTRSIANEGRDFGVRAYAIAPGAVETPMLRELFPESQIARDRTLDPHDVAHAIADCVLERRATASGTTINLPSP